MWVDEIIVDPVRLQYMYMQRRAIAFRIMIETGLTPDMCTLLLIGVQLSVKMKLS